MSISNLLKRLIPQRRGEVPEYSALRAVPTRKLPSGLAAEESGNSFTTRRDTIERSIIESDDRLRDDVPLFTEMIAPGGNGLLTIPLPDGSGHCLPVFTTPYRAGYYKQVLLRSGSKLRYLSSTAAQLIRMLRDIEGAGIKSLTVDRCPRCSIFIRTGTSNLTASRDLLHLWAIHKATELARFHLYFTYALQSARAGHLETARDVALETVGHISLEDPRPHLLLGELGVAFGDRVLVLEAQKFLRFLKKDAWERNLAEIARTGKPRFQEPELTQLSPLGILGSSK